MDSQTHAQVKHAGRRAQLPLIIASGITGIIALVWLSTLPARMGETIALNDTDADSETASGIPEEKGFGDIISDTKSQLGSIFESSKNAIQEAKQNHGGDSSLEQLSGNRQEASVIESAVETPTMSETASTSHSDPPPTTGGVAESTTTPRLEPVTPPAPRVILIGTTTSQ